MATILTPGFLRWDGQKYVLDPSLEGSLGPTIINSGTGTLNNIVSDENDVPAAIIAFSGASNMSVTGIVGGVESREIKIYNTNLNARLTLKHEDINSSVGNRITCPNGADFVLSYQEGAQLIYSNLESKWRITSKGIPTGILNDLVALDGYGSLKNLGQLPSITGTGPTITNSGTGTLNNIVTDEAGTPASVILFTGGSSMSVSGLAGGTESREIIVFNNDNDASLTLLHENGGSTLTNRIICPEGTSFVLSYQEAIKLVYSITEGKWRVVSKFISDGLPAGGSNGEIIRTTSGVAVWSSQDLPTLTNATDGSLNNIVSVDGTGAPVGAIRFTGDNNIDLTGIAGGYDGRRLLLIMAGTGEGNSLIIYDDDTGSAVANRFALPDNEIQINDTILLQYDGPQSRWKIAGQSPVVLPTFYSSLDIQNLNVSSINYADLFGKWFTGTILGSVTTSSTTPLDVPIYNDVVGDGIYYLETTVIMTRLTDATSAGVYKRSALYRRVNSGAVTIVGAIQTPVPDQETTAGDDVTIVANGNSIQVRVTAANSDPRRWLVEYSYRSMNSDP